MMTDLLLFLISNTILLTVQLTISKLLLLFLVTLVTLKLYKWAKQDQSNDKLVISPLPQQVESLIAVQIIAQIASLYLHAQSFLTYLIFVIGLAGFVVLAHLFTLQTVLIACFNALLVLQLRRRYLAKVDEKIRTRLGIRHTNSIYYNPISPPRRDLRSSLHVSPFRSRKL